MPRWATTCFARLQKRFEHGFADTREGYRNLLALAMTRRRLFVFGFLGAVAVSMLLVPFLGEDFFPAVDSGQITLHARTPAGTRIEDTTQIVAQIEREVRRVIPGRETGDHRGQYRPATRARST